MFRRRSESKIPLSSFEVCVGQFNLTDRSLTGLLAQDMTLIQKKRGEVNLCCERKSHKLGMLMFRPM